MKRVNCVTRWPVSSMHMLDNSFTSTSRFFLNDGEGLDSGWQVIETLPTTSSGIYSMHKARRGSRLYVLKALAPDKADNDVYRRLLRKEYEIGMWLSHPAIMRTFGMAHVEGVGHCIVLEYIDGVTLRDHLSSHTLTPGEAMAILVGICDALTYLHASQVVHLDLKPANIMLLRGSGRIKLIDFGFADGPAFVDLKAVGATPKYASPELLDGSDALDNRADIYSLGIIMQQMFPPSFRAGHRVAALCRSADSASRPADASLIIPMINRYRRRRTALSVAAIAMPVVVLAGVLLGQMMSKPSADVISHIPMTDNFTLVPDTVAQPVNGPLLPDSTLRPIVPEPSLLPDASHLPEVMTSPDVLDEQLTQMSDDSGDIFENQIYNRAMAAARHHWSDHLAALDTLCHDRTLKLCVVGHWRHLAKEEVKAWLRTKVPPESPAFNHMMELAAQTIKEYGEKEEEKGEAYSRWIKLYKRLGPVAVVTVTRTKIDDRRIRVDSLMEDGNYAISVYDPVATEMRTNSGWK